MKRIFAIAPVLLLAACVSSSDFQRLEVQVSDLQDDLNQIKRQSSSKEEVQQLNTNVAQQIDRLLKSNAEATAKLTAIDEKLDNNQGNVEQTNHRIDRLVQEITQAQQDIAALRAGAAPRAAGGLSDEVTVQAPVGSGSEDPLATYQAAYTDFQRGNFDLAYQGFSEFVQSNPNSDLADNASYWMAESLYSQKKYAEAIEQYNRVITTFPKSDKVPAALLKKGYSYISTGEKAQGIVQLQYVVHEHPKSQEAALARQKLKQLGIDSK